MTNPFALQGNRHDKFEVVEAECCRVWPVIRFGLLGRCGICQQVPVVKRRTQS